MTSTNDGPLLRASGVSAGYGQSTVLRNVSLTINPGQVAALVGPNGAGKTTLVRALSGLLRPTSGTIELAGDDVTHWPAFERARLGLRLVPEGRGIFRELTVRDNIYLQVPRSERKLAVERFATTFPALKDRLNQAAGSLSGGQQQMLALARCYLSDLQVVVVDEVSMGLAPLVVDQVYEILHDLADRGIALLIVEQYIDRVLNLADEVNILNQGEVVFCGAPDTLDRGYVMKHYMGIEDISDGGQNAPLNADKSEPISRD